MEIDADTNCGLCQRDEEQARNEIAEKLGG